ncbi:MAG: hypothetical protein A2Z76_02765 [Chloroflexi bacterium RBG_13_56_8b]|nr:MAG: hypothetical protein A2Z76_02765 [Chloroflexi bacterium RBG_13_56_8b]
MMAEYKGRSKKSFDRFLKIYKHKDFVFKLSNNRLLGKLGRKNMAMSSTTLTYLPIYENIQLGAGVAAPYSIIESFIREASHHVILHRCPCRSENHCEDFDPYFGCTFIGEATREVNPEVGRHVSMEEALEHLKQATEAGLISCVGHFKGDAVMLGIKDHRRMMTICHCCPCCCITTSMPLASREVRDSLMRLEGLTVEVDGEKCNGCSLCVKSCIFEQIEVVDKTAVIGEECKGCGRCAMVCKQEAISIRIDDPTYIEECMKRIGSEATISA